MSAIPAASVSMKTMADGTLRFTFDIEPKDAQDAFRLFASPGTPVAIAALKTGFAAVPAAKEEPEPARPLSKWLAIRCKEELFQSWLCVQDYNAANEENAAECVKEMMGIASRKEIDGNAVLEERFHRLIRIPYAEWIKGVA